MSHSEQEREIVTTPIILKHDRGGIHTSPMERRSYDPTPIPSFQSDTRFSFSKKISTISKIFFFLLFSSPPPRSALLPNRPNVYSSSSHSSERTGRTPSQLTSFYSSSPSTRTNPSSQRSDLDHRNHDSSTTIYSSSHRSDSLFNEPTRKYSARLISTSMNTRKKFHDSPSYQRPYSSAKRIPDVDDDDDDDEVPRQILLPIGGGIIGKLATSTTSLSYRK